MEAPAAQDPPGPPASLEAQGALAPQGRAAFLEPQVSMFVAPSAEHLERRIYLVEFLQLGAVLRVLSVVASRI